MTLQTQTFTHGRIRKAVYDPASKQLDLHWDNGKALAYKHVPAEVYRRLCSAPNPTTYWEDRIAEEYAKGTPLKQTGQPGQPGAPAEGGKTLSDLFGSMGADDDEPKP